MEKENNEIVFLVLTASLLIFILILLVINMLLTSRNKRLRHRSEMLLLKATLEQEIISTRLEVTESTLNEISRDLHDDIGQVLTFSIIQLNNLPDESEQQRSMLAETKNTLKEGLQSVRNLSKTLSTDYIHSFGIYESLTQLFEKITKRNLILAKFDYDDQVKFNQPEHELFLYRIIQECINNTLKHSQATELTLSIKNSAGTVEIIYTDNGIGMAESQQLLYKNSMGFLTMLKRTELMHGKLNLISSENKGVIITIVIPS
jgi:hypothetical protein